VEFTEQKNNLSAARGAWLNANASVRLCELHVLPGFSVLESFISGSGLRDEELNRITGRERPLTHGSTDVAITFEMESNGVVALHARIREGRDGVQLVCLWRFRFYARPSATA
jgi:hypothetical protein